MGLFLFYLYHKQKSFIFAIHNKNKQMERSYKQDSHTAFIAIFAITIYNSAHVGANGNVFIPLVIAFAEISIALGLLHLVYWGINKIFKK